jgi:hypothetical protein
MRYFVPDICPAPEAQPETAAQDKLGGIPWGLGRQQWPRCRACGKSQSLLAQLVHDRERLDLGRDGRVLFVFQCNHDPGMCSTWDGSSGANTCFVVDPDDLGHTLAELPEDSPLMENEVRVLRWIEKDDGLPESSVPLFYSSTAFNGLSDDILGKVSWGTRLGGVPRWLQSADEAPASPWRFVGQIDGTYSFLTPPRLSHAWISEDAERWEGRTHIGEGPNFGDGGIAYVFLDRAGPRPQGHVFWQCL